jgi:hypothetical protein
MARPAGFTNTARPSSAAIAMKSALLSTSDAAALVSFSARSRSAIWRRNSALTAVSACVRSTTRSSRRAAARLCAAIARCSCSATAA